MQMGMVGLGRMGANMARRLMRGGHEIFGLDLDQKAVDALAKDGAKGSTNLGEFVRMMAKPRTIWMMVPAGDATESMVNKLAEELEADDTIIDGGNSYYKDDVRRSKMLAAKHIHYCDAGTSGGVWGLDRGYCLMIGGEQAVVDRLNPIFKTLAPGVGAIERTEGRPANKGTAEEGYLYCGRIGAGHFVKMIHNGIEYGIMQSFGEGFDILKNANSKELAEDLRYNFDLGEIAEVWRRGSVVSSWLLDLAAMALGENPTLSNYTGYVQDSGEGRWTIMAALEEAVPSEVLAASLYARFRSRQEHTFSEKMLSAMRNKFGGHVELHPGQQ
ncbi:MAG: decarboxylating 6-phosphogluconate dehydrogenase [Acidobacteriota bacterium]|nr:decarboxylating 6-phosphogluconate dehydrogenase [Acidobacteriota bacterium]